RVDRGVLRVRRPVPRRASVVLDDGLAWDRHHLLRGLRGHRLWGQLTSARRRVLSGGAHRVDMADRAVSSRSSGLDVATTIGGVLLFEWTLVLLGGAVALTALARRLGVPYPSLLALGGCALALVNYSPNFQLDPSLALALFVAPVLLDAAFDTSLR